MSNPFLSELNDLLNKGIIDAPTAHKIRLYYQQKKENNPSSNRLTIVFAILGSLLIGMGIILIIAHNWDNLNRPIKNIIAFTPMLIGQIACVYTLLRKTNNVGWREASSTFLFFGVAICIAMISQIYHLEGSLQNFLLTWLLLCLPIMYLMRSSMASLLFLIGTTWYGILTYDYGDNSLFYWLLLLAALPYYYMLYQKNGQSNFFNYHTWLIGGSIIIMLASIEQHGSEHWLLIAYSSLAGVYYLLGHTPFFATKRLTNNPLLIAGSLGIVGLFLAGTFREMWKIVWRPDIEIVNIGSLEVLVSIALLTISAYLFFKNTQNHNQKDLPYIGLAPFIYLVLFLIAIQNPGLSAILANLGVLSLGVITILRGINKHHLGILNYGLLIITALIICRFFDTDLSFVLRGIMFVLVGIGFFAVNSWMIKKRKILRHSEITSS